MSDGRALLALELASQYKDEADRKLPEQNGLKGLQMVQFEFPRQSDSSVSFNSVIGLFPFLTISPVGS